MHCYCDTNNRAPRWTFTDPCKPEVRPGAREESASPAWLGAPAMNTPDTMKVNIWRLDTWCGPTLYKKCHSHNTQGKRHNNTWVESLAGNCTTSSTRQREQVWQKCKIQKNWCTVTVAPTIEHHGGHSRTLANQRWDQVSVMSRFDSTPLLENNGALTQLSDVTCGFLESLMIRKIYLIGERGHCI